MKRANWTIAQMCLTGGLLFGALVSQTFAQDAAGVVRISKPRTAPPVQPTTFRAQSAESAEEAAVPQGPIETGVGPAEVPAQTTSSDGSGPASAPGGYVGGVVVYDNGTDNDNWRTYDWSCDCWSCRFHRHTRDHSLACEAGLCRIRDGARDRAGRCRDGFCRACSTDDNWRTYDWSCDCRSCRFHRRTRDHSLACEAGLYRCRDGFCRACSHDPFSAHCHGQDLCYYLHCKFGYFCPSGKGIPCHGHYGRVYPQDVNYFDQRDGQLFSAQGYGVPIAVPLAPVVGHTYNYGWGVPSSRLTPISTLAPRY